MKAYRESKAIPFPKRNDVLQQPFFGHLKRDAVCKTLDLGGSGDCLLLCLQHYMVSDGDVIYSRESIYDFLGKPNNSFLEDDSLQILCHLFRINAFVIRQDSSLQPKSDCLLYDMGYPKTVSLLNYYPNHFVLITDLKLTDGTVLVSHESVELPPSAFSVTTGSVFDIDITTEYCDYRPSEIMAPPSPSSVSGDSEKDSGLSSDSEGWDSAAVINTTLPPRASAELLYSYFIDSDQFPISDQRLVLNKFYIAHNSMLDVLTKAENNREIMPDYFMKSYYKFRHNIFSALCILALGEREFKMGTDVSLESLIDSKKTPDYMIVSETSIDIYEFTVGNSYHTVDYYKGGGNEPIKYSQESREIEVVTGKTCQVHIVPAVLDEYNIKDISQSLSKHAVDFNSSAFEDFFIICNKNRSLITNATLSGSMNLSKSSFHTGLETFDRPQLSTTTMVSPDVLSVVLTESEQLYKKLSIDTRASPTRMYKLCFDINSGRLFYKPGKHGLKCQALKDILKKADVNKIVQLLDVYDGGASVSKNALRGTAPITVEASPKATLQNVTWDYSPLSADLYTRTKPQYPGLEPDCLDSSDIRVTSDLSKVAFPPDYFQKLCDLPISKFSNSKSPKLLANCTMNISMLVNSVRIYKEELDLKNSVASIEYPKPTYLFPLVSVPTETAELNDINETMAMKIYQSYSGGYTRSIMSKIVNSAYLPRVIPDEKIKNCRSEISKLNLQYFNKVTELNGQFVKFKQLPSHIKKELFPINNSLHEKTIELHKLMAQAKTTKTERLIRISLRKGGKNQLDFKSEMAHFEKTGSQYRGVGKLDQQQSALAGNYFSDLMSRLFEKGFHKGSYPAIYNKTRLPGPKFLNDLKNKYTENWDSFYENRIKGTMLEQQAFFVENLAKCLFNESVKSYNKDYVKVDNLGFRDIIVLIKGGSKIYKHQMSKLFKVAFYVSDEDMVYSGYEQNPNFQVIRDNELNLVVTPWSQVHQDVLFTYTSTLSSVFMNLYSMSVRSKIPDNEPLPSMIVLPVLMTLHNRRKTEKFMHNCRYLIVNPLSEMSNLPGIMPTFADFSYTYLDAWLRSRLEFNYLQFASRLLNLREAGRSSIDSLIAKNGVKDLWFDQPIVNADHLTTFIYATYMMTKSPVNSSLEQASNLWEILEDVNMFSRKHPGVQGLNDASLRMDVLNFNEDVYEDDFKYDPVYCQYLGHHLAGHLNRQGNVYDIHKKWRQIKSRDVSGMANSNGLRGYTKENFFNRKGYDVVFSHIKEQFSDESILNKVEDYLKSSMTDATNLINDDKVPFDALYRKQQLIFHIVHKIQRGGGREIFCMDLFTKARQNPLEALFKHICKKLPNEFISIPSNKRHGIIHSDFYEKTPGKWVKKVVRWVLDCRRWAPHSVFQKYMHFIHGLSPMLPSDFCEEFYEFGEMMFNKSFVTREHVLSKMRNNQRFEPYRGLMTQMEDIADAYSMIVPFSFVMGIFNYLSTLMHSANQIVASEVIRTICLKNDKGLVIMDPKCHSDDSIVTSYHSQPSSVKLSVVIYDWLLKGANHMLSIKKSQINNNVYLEFLSILYLYDRFLPVIPKFVSSIPFRPTDQGYSADISFAITQSIELLSQGGSFEECFLLLKLTENYIQRVYSITVNSDGPHQFLGSIDSHPLELLYAGGMADVARTMRYSPESFWKQYHILVDNDIMDPETADCSLNWDMGSKVSDRILAPYRFMDKLQDKLDKDAQWTLSNCTLGNSVLNLFWYYNKLKDRKFYSSIVDEPQARRYSRIFGAYNYRVVRSTKDQLVKVDELSFLLKMHKDYPVSKPNQKFQQYIEYIARDLESFYDCMDNATMGETQNSELKDKPTVFRQGESYLGRLKINSTDFVSYVKEPAGFKLLGRRINPYRDIERISNHLDMLDIEWRGMNADRLCRVTRRVLREDSREYRLISPIPGVSRVVDSFQSVMTLIEYNSFAHKKLTVHNKSASIMDWNRKVIQGRVPDIVKQYLSIFWVVELMQQYSVLDKDIFKENPTVEYQRLGALLPEEWRPVLETTKHLKNVLNDMHYWSYWPREQVKYQGRWYGSGKCMLNLREAFMIVEVNTGSLYRLRIEGDYEGKFSIPSSWYLNNFLNFSGINASFVNAEFGDPNEKYLGYNTKESVYGIGRPKAFDMVLMEAEFETNIMPPFCFKEMSYQRSGRHVYYKDADTNTQYKIDFFVPLIKEIVVDVSKYTDPIKIKENLKNPQVYQFVNKLALQYGASISYKKDHLLDNIGQTLLFNIIRNHQDSIRIYNQEKQGDGYLLLESMLEWKKTHPDFGFYSEEQLSEYLVNNDLPPVPEKVYLMLSKLGHSTIGTSDYNQIVFKVLNMPNTDRLSYLLTNYPELTNTQKMEGLVLATRSDRIYSLCQYLGARHWEVLIPLITAIGECIELGQLNSETLENDRSYYNFRGQAKWSSRQVFEILSTELLLHAISTMSISNTDPLQAKWMKIVTELVDDDLLEFMNICTGKSTLLMSVEFSVSKEKFMNWVIDVWDSSFMFFPEMNIHTKKQLLFGESGKLSTQMGPFRKYAIKMNMHPGSNTLHLTFSKPRRNMKVTLNTQTKLGLLMHDFLPLDEDGVYEMECSYMYMDEEDYYEDLTFDELDSIDEYGYAAVQHLDLKTAITYRGSGQNVFYVCTSLSREMFNVTGKVQVFKRDTYSSNPYRHYSELNSLLVYIGVKKFKGKVEGYKQIQWQNIIHYTQGTSYKQPEMLVGDKNINKIDFLNDPAARKDFVVMDRFFTSHSANTQTSIVEEAVELHKSVTESGIVSPKYESMLKRFTELKERYQPALVDGNTSGEGQNNHQEQPSDELVSESKNLLTLVRELMATHSISDFVKSGKNTDITTRSLRKYKPFSFKDPIKVLDDPKFKAEFETLFPGYWEELINGKVTLSKKTKFFTTDYARMRIDRMPDMMRKKYRKLLLIVQFILDFVPECPFRQNETHDFGRLIDDLFDVDYEPSIDMGNIINDLSPELPGSSLEIDLSNLGL